MQNATLCLRAEVVGAPSCGEGDCRFVVAVDDGTSSSPLPLPRTGGKPPARLPCRHRAAGIRAPGLTVSPQQVELLLREHAPRSLFESTQSERAPSGPLHFHRIIATAHTLRPLLQVAARLFTRRWAVALALLFIVVESMVAARHLMPRRLRCKARRPLPQWRSLCWAY